MVMNKSRNEVIISLWNTFVDLIDYNFYMMIIMMKLN
jgi:hypothetical protein